MNTSPHNNNTSSNTSQSNHNPQQENMMNTNQHLTNNLGDALTDALAEQAEAEAQAYEQAVHPTMGGDHTDRREVESLDEPTAIVGQWVDLVTGKVLWDHASEQVEDRAKKLATQGLNPYKARKKARRQLNSICLKQWVENPDTGRKRPVENDKVLGQVQMYLGEPDGRPPFLLYPEGVTFIFTTLDTRSSSYQEGVKEALVVAYHSFKAQERVWVDRDTGVKSVYETQDDIDYQGTLGVVRYYATAEEADEAREELRKAVWAFQRSMVSADRDDTPLADQDQDIDDLTW